MTDWISPETIAALDLAVLAALTVAICVGAAVLQKLNALQADRANLTRELEKFATQAHAAEAGLNRLKGALQVEVAQRQSPTAPQVKAPQVKASKPAAAPSVPAANAPSTAPGEAPAPQPTDQAAAQPAEQSRRARRRKPAAPANGILSMQ